MSAGAKIRRLGTDEWRTLRELRLRALLESPAAFAESLTEAAARPDAGWSELTASVAAPTEQAAFVAWFDDAPVGIVYALLDRQNPHAGRLGGLWVDRGMRKRGIGAALVQAVRRWAAEGDKSQVLLWVPEDAAPARRLYDQTGFEPTGRRSPFPGDDTRELLELRLVVEIDPIEVRSYGSHSRTVVVLHGGPGAPGSAAGLARALAQDFRVLEPLQRRSGRVPLSVSRHVEDLLAVVPRPAILIGWSWGAMLGLSFAARYPAAVAALVLVGCGTYDESSRALYRQSLGERLSSNQRKHTNELEVRLRFESDAAVRDSIFGELGAAYMVAESYQLIDESDDGTAARSADEAGYVETWTDVLRLQREGIEPAAFGAVTAPVLMIHGAVDPHPGEPTRALLERYIPQLEYLELDRCGHEPWRERYARARFLESVRRWMDQKT